MFPKSSRPLTGFSIDRLNGFTDGVLAIVITLLVLGIDVPEGHKFSEQGLMSFLFKISRDVIMYAASFLLVGTYWVQHHAIFHFFRSCNRTLIWLNILFMFPITLVPFLTKLKVVYRQDAIVVPLFGAAFILSSLILFAIWRYAISHPELLGRQRFDPSVERSMNRRIVTAPLVCLAAIGLSFLNIDLGTIAFCTVPLFYLSHHTADANFKEADE
jgi:uncharacterized membrane protein